MSSLKCLVCMLLLTLGCQLSMAPDLQFTADQGTLEALIQKIVPCQEIGLNTQVQMAQGRTWKWVEVNIIDPARPVRDNDPSLLADATEVAQLFLRETLNIDAFDQVIINFVVREKSFLIERSTTASFPFDVHP